MSMRMHPFSAGTYVVDRGIMDNISWGNSYEHPNPMFAIRHPRGVVVFDTGHNHRSLADPRAWYGKQFDKIEKINVTEEDCLPAQLRRVGIDPAEVTHVVMSHLHIDHSGEMESFPQAKFIVRASEMSYAWWPARHMRGTYVVNDLINTRHFDYLELPDVVDFDLFEDGSLVCVHTPGHTPGHQSLVVRLPDYDKPMVLCADACYTPFNLEGNQYTSSLMWNVQAWFHSIQKLKHLSEKGYELWYGHDMEEWKARIKAFV